MSDVRESRFSPHIGYCLPQFYTLAATAEMGWRLTWLAARNRLHAAAGAVATTAVLWVARLHEECLRAVLPATAHT